MATIFPQQIKNKGMTVDKKDVNEMTREEFEAIPYIDDWQYEAEDFDSLVILPTEDIHDSDFRCMAFIVCRKGEPICKVGGGSDVIHIDGIGGYGYDWLRRYGTCPKMIEPVGWNIDCLKVSGLLRLFTHGNLRHGAALSSFEVFSIREPKGEFTAN